MLEDIPRPALAGGAILAVLLVLFAAIAGVNSVSSALTNSDELEPLPTGPPPSMPEAARVVDDIETLADFGYRKIDTVAHSNAVPYTHPTLPPTQPVYNPWLAQSINKTNTT